MTNVSVHSDLKTVTVLKYYQVPLISMNKDQTGRVSFTFDNSEGQSDKVLMDLFNGNLHAEPSSLFDCMDNIKTMIKELARDSGRS